MPINFAIKLVATVALEAGQMALQASKKTYGPRLSETQVTTADYGTPLPRFLGARLLTGQIVWSKDLEIVDHTTKIKGGGKQETQSALWTAGVALADCRGGIGPIDKVLKIWLDETLAYDATGKGPISYSSSLGFDLADVMRIATGGEDQMPDPAYVDYCEEKYGPDSAPAFRGTALLTFEKMPVDNFGNRPPQIKVLAVSNSSAILPFEQVDENVGIGTSGRYAAGGTWIAHAGANSDPIAWWDAPTRTLLGQSSGSDVFPGTVSNLDLANDGTAYFVGQYQVGLSVFTALYTCPPLGIFTREDIPGGNWFAGPTRVFDLDDGTRAVLSGLPSGATGYIDQTAVVADSLTGCDFALHGDGSVWGMFEPDSSSNSITLKPITGSAAPPITFLGSVGRSHRASDATFCHVAGSAHFFVVSDGKWYIIADDTAATPGAIIASGSSAPITINLPRNAPNRTSFWSSYSEISLADGSTIRSVNPSDWVAEDTDGEDFYDRINNAIWVNAQFATHQTIRYLDRLGNAGVTLGAIVSKMCDAAGLESRDTSLLTQAVAGYSWTRGDVKSQMEPILDIHDVDARPHDWLIEFKPRGSAPSGTILTADFARNGDKPRSTVTEAEDTDLPRTLRVNFADTGHDQDSNNVIVPLPIATVDSQRDVTLALDNYADTPDGAQQKGDRYMRRTWNGKSTIDTSLTAQSRALEPGDVTTLDLDGTAWSVKLEKQTFVGGRMDCTFRRDEATLALLNGSTTGPGMGARTPGVVRIPSPVRGFIVDAPYRSDDDADVRPLLYAGAGAYAELDYPGAAIFEASGAGASRAYDTLFDTPSAGATWGLCESTLGSVPSSWLWDRGNTLTVLLQNGTLSGASEDDIDADPSLNLLLVGRPGAWEYVNFTTAALQGDGTYKLSGFKRGRRGTEWACGGHAARELFVLASALDAEEMGSDDVGGSLSFKAQAIGRSLADAPAIDIAPYQGQTQKPYAPANVKWTFDGTDLTGTITRRTRIGGAWVGGAAIPLSESSEAYEVDVYNGAILKRTITVSGTNVFTYTAAMAVADGIALPTPPGTQTYQMSDAVGRGFALAA